MYINDDYKENMYALIAAIVSDKEMNADEAFRQMKYERHNKPQLKTSNELISHMVDLENRGYKRADIARELNIDTSRVSKLLIKARGKIINL